MDDITSYLTSDHKRCDELFIEAENCVSTDRWDRADTCFQGFCDALERHFAMEEEVLFSAFEKATGRSDGPTTIMRNEHQQLRGIAYMLQTALERRDPNAFLGHSDTLNIMMQQHNIKEENILYPMTDCVLSSQKSHIIDAMSDIAVKL